MHRCNLNLETQQLQCGVSRGGGVGGFKNNHLKTMLPVEIVVTVVNELILICWPEEDELSLLKLPFTVYSGVFFFLAIVAY